LVADTILSGHHRPDHDTAAFPDRLLASIFHEATEIHA